MASRSRLEAYEQLRRHRQGPETGCSILGGPIVPWDDVLDPLEGTQGRTPKLFVQDGEAGTRCFKAWVDASNRWDMRTLGPNDPLPDDAAEIDCDSHPFQEDD